jgi:hypothetical protein
MEPFPIDNKLERIGLSLLDGYAFVESSNAIPVRFHSTSPKAAIALAAGTAAPFLLEANEERASFSVHGTTLNSSGLSIASTVEFGSDGMFSRRMLGMEAADYLSSRFAVDDMREYSVGFQIQWDPASASESGPFHVELLYYAYGNTSLRAFHRISVLFAPDQNLPGMINDSITTTTTSIRITKGGVVPNSNTTARAFVSFAAIGSDPIPFQVAVKLSVWAPAELHVQCTPFFQAVDSESETNNPDP